jgi:polyhydroxyalkanoate synthesis regulator phasin
MFEMLEKAILTGLGAVAVSQKMAEEFIKELKEKYKISEDEGKVFLEKIQTMAKDSKTKITEMAEAEVKKAIDKIGLVPRSEFEQLQKRVAELESRCGGTQTGAQ